MILKIILWTIYVDYLIMTILSYVLDFLWFINHIRMVNMFAKQQYCLSETENAGFIQK